MSVALDDGFDAAIGRMVLMYTGDVTATLRAVVDRVKPGGVAAFAEGEFAAALGCVRLGAPGMRREWE